MAEATAEPQTNMDEVVVEDDDTRQLVEKWFRAVDARRKKNSEIRALKIDEKEEAAVTGLPELKMGDGPVTFRIKDTIYTVKMTPPGEDIHLEAQDRGRPRKFSVHAD